MKISTNWLIQIPAVVLQGLNILNGLGLPTKYQFAITSAISMVQLIVAVIAHYSTPTGVAITPGSMISTPESQAPQAAHASPAK